MSVVQKNVFVLLSLRFKDLFSSNSTALHRLAKQYTVIVKKTVPGSYQIIYGRITGPQHNIFTRTITNTDFYIKNTIGSYYTTIIALITTDVDDVFFF